MYLKCRFRNDSLQVLLMFVPTTYVYMYCIYIYIIMYMYFTKLSLSTTTQFDLNGRKQKYLHGSLFGLKFGIQIYAWHMSYTHTHTHIHTNKDTQTNTHRRSLAQCTMHAKVKEMATECKTIQYNILYLKRVYKLMTTVVAVVVAAAIVAAVVGVAVAAAPFGLLAIRLALTL